jgi:hypothetical protein
MMAVTRPCSGLAYANRQRQRDDADREAGADVGGEAVAVVTAQRVNQARAEGVELAGQHATSGQGTTEREQSSSQEVRSGGAAR